MSGSSKGQVVPLVSGESTSLTTANRHSQQHNTSDDPVNATFLELALGSSYVAQVLHAFCDVSLVHKVVAQIYAPNPQIIIIYYLV